MKNIAKALSVLCIIAVFAACGGDDDDDSGSSQSSSSSSSTSNSNNTNMNEVDDDAAVLRLEFPKLKGGNSKVIVNRTTGDTQYDADEVNYCVEWDCDLKSQRWSCYQMHKGYTGSYSRVVSGYLDYDEQLDEDESWGEDLFYNSGYQHGHICPNADRKFSRLANYQTFYLTNMQPQYSKFNGYSGSDEGLWLRIEEQVRDVTPTSSSDTLYVCKGGTIDDEDNIIEYIDDKLIVPKYFFTALLMYSSGSYRAIGFWVEQTNDYCMDTDIKDCVVSIDELEELTGIDFFCNLPDATENSVEKSYNTSAWGLNK